MVGWLDGQLEDQYTQNVNKSTVYEKKTKGGSKSTTSKDVVILGTDGVGNLQTTRIFGGPGNDVATSITTITPTDGNVASSSGGFAMTGFFESSIDFSGNGSGELSASGTDAFVAIFDSNGSYINSTNSFVDAYDVKGKAISSDSQGDFILVLSVKESAEDQVGYTMILKLDANLEVMWELPIIGDGHNIDPGNVMIYNYDNIIIAGSFEGVIQIGNKQRNVVSGMHAGFITRVSKNGVPSWIKQVGKSSDPIMLTAVSEAVNNEFYLAGHFTDDVEISNTTIHVGSETTSFIAKYARNGSLIEIHSLGEEAFFQVNDMSSDRKGGLGLVGKYSGGINIRGFELPDENGEERGFFIPLSELFADGKSIFQDISNTNNYQQEFSQEETSVNIYPNPFKDYLNIEYFAEQAGEIKLGEGLQNVNGVLQLKTTATDGSVFIDKVIKLQ